MANSRGTGGSPQHDLRREGAVTPPEHNLQRKVDPSNKAEAGFNDPDRAHQAPSGREIRRQEEREGEKDR